MTKTWENVEEGEHDDDFICMNGNACDHPWCPEHGDPEDDYASDDIAELVRDLWGLNWERQRRPFGVSSVWLWLKRVQDPL